MNHLTPIGSRLRIALDTEHRRMQNEWFFKWHFIKGDRPVEIESFDGKPIVYGGIKFSGTARTVYWDAIQRYLRKKISTLFDELENELQKYPVEVREQALGEAVVFINGFSGQIRNAAIEKDRILRGNGIDFPPAHDSGRWEGVQPADIRSRAQILKQIYCDHKLIVDGVEMSIERMAKDKVSLVKQSGAVVRADIPAIVTPGTIVTFVADLPIEIGDHILRQLPSGLVDDFVVADPGFTSGVGPVKSHFQIKVRRSDEQAAPAQTVINHITGNNARVNISSVDNSINSVIENSAELFRDISAALAKGVADGKEREKLLELVQELQNAKQNGSFKEKYQAFIASAANHMTVVAPFLPALTGML